MGMMHTAILKFIDYTRKYDIVNVLNVDIHVSH